MQKLITIAITVATIWISGLAHASYTGLQVERVQVTLQDGTLMNRFRVYAVCSDPDDYIIACSGSPTVGNLVIQSRNLDDSGFGDNFYNPPGGGLFAPSAAAIAANPDVAHDTFVTLGVSIADQAPGSDLTGGSPGFPGIGNLTQINSNNMGWFVPGPPEQSRAGFTGDGDLLLRVLIMQLTVSSTSNVRGTVAISGVNHLVSGPTAFTIGNQTFSSIPGPGAVGLLGVAALVRNRRRQSHIV